MYTLIRIRRFFHLSAVDSFIRSRSLSPMSPCWVEELEGGAHGFMLWRRVPLAEWYFFSEAYGGGGLLRMGATCAGAGTGPCVGIRGPTGSPPLGCPPNIRKRRTRGRRCPQKTPKRRTPGRRFSLGPSVCGSSGSADSLGAALDCPAYWTLPTGLPAGSGHSRFAAFS